MSKVKKSEVLRGALKLLSKNRAGNLLIRAIANREGESAGNVIITQWNDRPWRKKSEVIDVLDAAVKLARKAERRRSAKA